MLPFLCKKEEEENLFDFNDMRIELVLEILYYMTAARKDRARVLKWWTGSRPQTNQVGTRRRGILRRFDNFGLTENIF